MNPHKGHTFNTFSIIFGNGFDFLNWKVNCMWNFVKTGKIAVQSVVAVFMATPTDHSSPKKTAKSFENIVGVLNSAKIETNHSLHFNESILKKSLQIYQLVVNELAISSYYTRLTTTIERNW